MTADSGGRLRREREHRRLSRHEVSRLTELSIQAIERNDGERALYRDVTPANVDGVRDGAAS